MTNQTSIEEFEDVKSPNHLYSTMQNRVKNPSESRGDYQDDEVRINTPTTRNAPFNFKNLKNEE